MDGSSAFRRAFHIVSPIFLAYYALPDPIGRDLPKTSVALLFLGTALCIEIARIALGIQLFGLRGYEGQRVSAYAQGALGLAFGIFVIQDPRIVVPAFLGMAWIDPLAAYARARAWPRASVGFAYFALFLGTVLVMGSFALRNAMFFALAATVCALAVEGPRGRQLDDDLLMQVVPYVVVYYLLAGFGTGLDIPLSL